MKLHLPAILSCILFSALVSGYAADKSEASKDSESAKKAKKEAKKGYKDRQFAAEPTKVKFGEFKRVELKGSSLAPEFQKKKANQESTKKIDEMLQRELKGVWPDLQVIPPGGEFTKSAERTLQITPSIEDIKLVGVGSRVMWGAMAGGSDIVMKVTYRDSSTGEVIANPDFWKGNNAWAGGSSWGKADNEIRDAVVAQIANYTRANK
jgi:hypothetical protein